MWGRGQRGWPSGVFTSLDTSPSTIPSSTHDETRRLYVMLGVVLRMNEWPAQCKMSDVQVCNACLSVGAIFHPSFSHESFPGRKLASMEPERYFSRLAPVKRSTSS